MSSSSFNNNTNDKKLVDCCFYIADPLSCRNGVHCRFRHSAAASIQEEVCRHWLHGRCRDRMCPFRHPGIQAPSVQRSTCSSCFEYNCICGYGNTATMSYLEQSPPTEATPSQKMHVAFGCTFSGVKYLPTYDVEKIQLSQDGNTLVTYGQSSQAKLWSTRTLEKGQSISHSKQITDVCFGVNQISSSSKDRTVKIWDVNLQRLTTRCTTVLQQKKALLSLDVHPITPDILCTMDRKAKVTYWNWQQRPAKKIQTVRLNFCGEKLKHGKIRMQPVTSNLLAAAVATKVELVDVETGVCKHALQGHKYAIESLCWKEDGSLLASTSEDIINIWDVRANNARKNRGTFCLNSAHGNLFHDAVFHPAIPVMVIGLQKNMELWQYGDESAEARTTMFAESVGSVSTGDNILASSHDNGVRLWQC